MIAIVDIDGVLADATHREHHVRRRPKDWDAFFAAVGHDTVIEAGKALAAKLAADHEVVLLTGRPERIRESTEAWLADHGIPYSRLVLRPDADHRPAAVFKAQAVAQLGSPDEVAVIVDDDPGVVEALRNKGYGALQFG